jgi:outer membrane receptor protein involved in Fe transport
VSFTTQVVNAATVPQRVNGSTYYLTRDEYAGLIRSLGTTTGGAPMFAGLQGASSSIPNRLAFANFSPSLLSQYYDLSGFDQDLVRSQRPAPDSPVEDRRDGRRRLRTGNLETHVFGMRLTGNAGVRYVYTRDVGTGTNIRRQTRFTATGGTRRCSACQLSLRNSYVDILPAFNAALELTPDLVFRANWAKNLARPKPTDLVPNINCLDDATVAASDDVCTAGNPALKPYRADQWEVNLAWYPNKDTLFSLGYYKNMRAASSS